MLQTVIRPLTATERERLEAELLAATDPKQHTATVLFHGFAGGIGGLVVGALLFLFLCLFHLAAHGATLILGSGAIIGFALGLRNGNIIVVSDVQDSKKQTALLTIRLGRNEIEEVSVTATAFAQASNIGYFFDIGDNRVLFLWDYDLGFDDGDPQPVSAFTFTRFLDAPDNVWHLAPSGEPLEPGRELTFTSLDAFDPYHGGAVFENATLATLETDLPHLAVAPDD